MFIYFSPQDDAADKLKDLLKTLYDYIKSLAADDDSGTGNALEELIIQHMDEEQIWQQLELNNEEIVDQSLKIVPSVLSIHEEKLQIPYKSNQNDQEPNDDEEQERDEVSDSKDVHDDQNQFDQREKSSKLKKGKPSVVDDKFFKLYEMEEFLQIEDQKEMKRSKGRMEDEDDDSEVDYFEDMSDEEDSEAEYERNLHYNEYFDPEENGAQVQNRKSKDSEHDDDSNENEPSDREKQEDQVDFGKKKVKFDLSLNIERKIPSNNKTEANQESSSDEENDESLTSFQRKQKELRKQLKEIEARKKGEKPWQMKGEIDSSSRPQDALLDEDLDFDLATRPAPTITYETTLQLEDIIKQRIRDQAFDDVERKLKPTVNPLEYRKELVLDQEKSKLSLAQIYEKEYLKSAAKVNPDAETEDPESKEKKEIRRRMKTLFAKLDALSNYYFTPKPAEPELKIITNTQAINMEEVAPIAMSDANLLAPEEVKAKPKGEIIAKEEMNKTDKNRFRRQKKQKQRERKKHEEAKQNAAAAKDPRKQAKLEDKKLLTKMLKNKSVEKMKVADGNNLKSTFFSRLQEKVKAPGTEKGKKSKDKISSVSQGISAKFYKL